MAAPVVPSWPANNRRNLYQFDAKTMQADFEKEEERLFVLDDEVQVSIIETKEGGKPRRLEFGHADEIKQYTKQEPNTTTVILIRQTFSWGELEISKSATQDLFSHFDISPGFWPAVKLFGCKDSSEHESEGGFNELARSDDGNSFEFSYTVKHVEEHGRQGAYDPWSIRQMGINHKYDAAQRQNTFVILNPSQGLMKRLDNMSPDAEMLDIHRLILCAAVEHWNQYLAHLESLCKDISQKAVLANGPQPQNLNSRGFQVNFMDSQRISDLQETMIHVSHMLDLNLSIFDALLSSLHLFTAAPHNTTSSSGHGPSVSTTSSISTLSIHTKLWKDRVENLLRSLDGSSVLIRNILSTHSLSTLQMSSATTAELAALARRDAQKANRDARTLNAITILGFVYLPASFVATLLGTQYISIHSDADGGHVSVSFAREMWIFVILTVLLLAVTVGSWGVWERRMRRVELREAKAGDVV